MNPFATFAASFAIFTAEVIMLFLLAYKSLPIVLLKKASMANNGITRMASSKLTRKRVILIRGDLQHEVMQKRGDTLASLIFFSSLQKKKKEGMENMQEKED